MRTRNINFVQDQPGVQDPEKNKKLGMTCNKQIADYRDYLPFQDLSNQNQMCLQKTNLRVLSKIQYTHMVYNCKRTSVSFVYPNNFYATKPARPARTEFLITTNIGYADIFMPIADRSLSLTHSH